MKRASRFLLMFMLSVIVAGNAFAQDLNSVTETYNNAATALNEGKNDVALTGFESALKAAQALGEEGTGIVNDCKNVIPKILLLVGKEAANAKNLDGAIDFLHKAITRATEYNLPEIAKEAKELIPVIVMADANSLLNEGKFEEAATQYKKVIAEDASNGTAYLRLGMCQAKLNDDNGAVASYLKSSELGEKEDAYKQLSTFYAKNAAEAYKTKNNAAALENALKAESYVPNPQVAKIGGIAAFNTNKFDQAIELLNKVVADNPKATDALLFLARSYEGKGNKAKAVEFYKKVVGDPKFAAFANGKIKALAN